MKTISLPLTKIKLNKAVQPRVELDRDHIENYVEDLREGADFPPVVVFYDGKYYYLADGFHRYMAHQYAGLKEIKAEIRKGEIRQAILYAVGANATHGKRRTNADKRKSAMTMLKDPLWGSWTDGAIAKYCRVSQPFISAIRKELTDKGYEFTKKRLSSDGRKMDVTNIGSTRTAGGKKPEVTKEDPVDVKPVENATPKEDDRKSELPQVVAPAKEQEAEQTSGQMEGPEIKPVPIPDLKPGEPAGEPKSPSREKPEESEAEAEEQGSDPDDNDVPSPNDSDAETEAPPTDAEDMEPLNQKVHDLELELAEAKRTLDLKNELIAKLEEKIRSLEEENEYYRNELIGVKKENEDLITHAKLNEASEEMGAFPA